MAITILMQWFIFWTFYFAQHIELVYIANKVEAVVNLRTKKEYI